MISVVHGDVSCDGWGAYAKRGAKRGTGAFAGAAGRSPSFSLGAAGAKGWAGGVFGGWWDEVGWWARNLGKN